jgi:hypothetical protein
VEQLFLLVLQGPTPVRRHTIPSPAVRTEVHRLQGERLLLPETPEGRVLTGHRDRAYPTHAVVRAPRGTAAKRYRATRRGEAARDVLPRAIVPAFRDRCLLQMRRGDGSRIRRLRRRTQGRRAAHLFGYPKTHEDDNGASCPGEIGWEARASKIRQHLSTKHRLLEIQWLRKGPLVGA